uniref:Uncharacterized protein n=1 Tax=Arundo donax TaxID=35708 RepID=A0A0A8YRU3_ARUDO
MLIFKILYENLYYFSFQDK